MLAQPGVQLHAAEQAVAAQIKVEQAKNASLGQAAGEFFQLVELAGEVAAADKGADGRTGNHRHFDAGFIQCAQDADMGPATGAAAAEGQCDSGFFRRFRTAGAARG